MGNLTEIISHKTPLLYILHRVEVVRNNNRQIRISYLFIVVFLSTIIFSSTTMINGFTNVIYGQSNTTQSNSTQTNHTNATKLVNIQDIPLKKVHVGDIDIAYKVFGKGDPILLISPAHGDMNAWKPSTLSVLSSNHTVTVFDNRGVGNTTAGTKSFSVQ